MYLYTRKEGVKIIMPDTLRKINYNRTKKDIDTNIPWFSIHSSTIERTLFKEDATARTMSKFPHTVPNYYKNNKYTYIKSICIKSFSLFAVIGKNAYVCLVMVYESVMYAYLLRILLHLLM